MLTEQTVRHVLSGIDEPELKKPLTDLDLIRKIDIDNDTVTVGISLIETGGAVENKLRHDITNGLSLIPGVKSVHVECEPMSDQQLSELRQKLGGKKHEAKASIIDIADRFIVVTSGKGGVGKSTITSNLAVALAKRGHMVGLLDADVYGFSIPHMLGISGQPTAIDDKLIPLRKGDNLQVVSMGFFVKEDDPVIWRGPMLHKAINQFLTDVKWDNLDFLLLDLPPGTGDVTLTIAQAIPAAEMLVVTTPQVTATHVAGRVARLAERTKLKVIGVIENMSYYDNNGQRDYIFGKGGGKELAKQLKVPLLGEIPLMTSLREGADTGRPAATDGSPEQIKLFAELAQAVENAGVR